MNCIVDSKVNYNFDLGVKGLIQKNPTVPVISASSSEIL